MATKGGQSKNNNAGKNKPWQDALRKMAMRPSGDVDVDGKEKRKLELIAESVVTAAINGDLQAAKEIGDRLDGKSTDHKQVSGSVSHDHSGLPSASEILAEFAGDTSESGTEAPTTH